METTERSLSIKNWTPEDRPREKLILKGKSSLSNTELIALLIGSGTKSISAVELGKRVMQRADNNLHQLARQTVKDLKKITGIGQAKAMIIVAALERGRRRKELDTTDKAKISKSNDAFELL